MRLLLLALISCTFLWSVEKPTKAPKPPKAPKAPKLPKTPASAPGTPGKRGRKPGMKQAATIGTKPGRTAGKAGSSKAAAALAIVIAAFKQAEDLANDSLAVAVHHLNKSQRNVVESILKSLR